MDPSLKLFDSSTPLTITQLSSHLKQHIESQFSSVYLQGEISGCKYHSSGHIYFSLKDDKSVLDAICWRGTHLPVTLKDGMCVTCRGRLTTYGGRSKYQIIIESLEHAGQGVLLQLVEQLKVKLSREGLFSPQRKKSLPLFPKVIGLITSPTGAVIQDMASRFENRLPCRFFLYPVAVQGASVVQDILKALHYFWETNPQPDLLIIARGGGSVEDLWPFHDEQLVRAVASSPIPIISAIGHETDTTLIDYAADVRAPTPTAAAEIALPSCADLRLQLEGYEQRTKRALINIYMLWQAHIKSILVRLQIFRNFLEPLSQHLDDIYDMMTQNLSRISTSAYHRLDLINSRLGKGPSHEISLYDQKSQALFHSLHRFLHNLIEQKKSIFFMCDRLLAQLSYHKTLERGFSLVFDPSHHVVTSKERAGQQESLTIRFHDGEVEVDLKVDPLIRIA